MERAETEADLFAIIASSPFVSGEEAVVDIAENNNIPIHVAAARKNLDGISGPIMRHLVRTSPLNIIFLAEVALSLS